MSARSPAGLRHVVLLAGRRSTKDPLAEAAGAPHRALLDIDGEPMLVRVARRLLAWPSVERVFISIDSPDLLETIPFVQEARSEGRIAILRSADSPSQSVLDALAEATLDAGPVLVTTADHALLDDEILRAFFESAAASPADLNVGLVSRTIIEARFPTTKRTYLGFRDDGYSGANLFLFKNRDSLRAAEFWRRIEKQRKKPWRIARAFGIVTLVLFVTRRLTLSAAMKRVSETIGTRVESIALPIAEAAVDVDKIEDWELVREILAGRRENRMGHNPEQKTL